MKILDCFGDICPIPMLKIEKEIKESNSGDIFLVVVDHSCVIQSIISKYTNHRLLEIKIEEVMNGVWEIVFMIK